jgi:hypothetical protein
MNYISVLCLAIILLFITAPAYSMETLSLSGGDDAVTSEVDELSPCGKKITEFKFFLRDGKRCIRDTDCIVLEGGCPLGCKFYINKNFEAILSSRVEDVAELCDGSVCSRKCSDPSSWPKATCTDNGKCVADI